MRHKCKCQKCGELAYLHGVELPGNYIAWICDNCMKPVEVKVTYYKENKDD